MARYNNKRKQSLMMCMVSILLFIFGVTAGISYAYFTDHKEVSNTLNFGKLIISTNENNVVDLTLTGNPSDTETKRLGVSDKVTITGSIGLEEGSVPAYIRMKMKVYEKGTTTEIISTFNETFMAEMAKVVYKDSNGAEMQWFVVGNYLYLGNKIEAGNPFVYSEANTNEITLTEAMVPKELQGKDVDVKFTLQAIQSAGMGLTLSNYTQANATKIAGIPVWNEIYFNALDENALGVYEAPTHTGNAMDARGTFSKGKTNSEGKYTHIELGTYPQTFHSTDGKGLTKVTGKTYTLYNNASSGAGVKTDYAIYTDGTDEYVEITTVRSSSTDYYYSDGTNKINDSATAYFKLEPIVWEILGVTNADGTITVGGYDGKTAGVKLLLSSVKILTAMQFALSSTSYTDDTNVIRPYLNGGSNSFLSQAFTSEEQGKIAETTLEAGTDGYYTAKTTYSKPAKAGDGDKVFLLSYGDLIKTEYGFNSSYSASDASRIKYPTDYAGANYAYRSNTANYGGYWWSRSAYSSASVWNVYYVGDLYYTDPDTSNRGVVPALFLSI